MLNRDDPRHHEPPPERTPWYARLLAIVVEVALFVFVVLILKQLG